jgi:hypothetical protein
VSKYQALAQKLKSMIRVIRDEMDVQNSAHVLPYLVYKVAWTTANGDDAPDVTEWNAVLSGERPELVTDWPGYEEQNRMYELVKSAKVYLNFDPNAEEGVDP